MSTALRSLFAAFDVDTGGAAEKISSLSSTIDGARDALGVLAKSAFGAFSFGALKSFITGQIDAAKEVRLTAAKLGVSTDFLEEWTFAAGSAGVSAEGAANGLKFLNKNMGEALAGQKEAVETFRGLDVALKGADGQARELDDVLPELADSFARMGSQQERTTAAMKIFGRQGADLLPLLQQGATGVEELRARFHELGGGMSEDFIAKAKEAGKAIAATKFGLGAFKRAIAAELLPYVIQFAQGAQKVTAYLVALSRETNIVKDFLLALGVAGALSTGKLVAGWVKVLGLFKGGSIWSNLFSLGQLGLIVGALLLVAGAVDDIVTMVQGGESVLGSFFDQMGLADQKKEIIDSLTKAWADMQVPLGELRPLVGDVVAGFAKTIPYAIALVLDLGKALYTVGSFLEKIGEALGELLTGGGIDGASKRLTKWADDTVDFWKNGSATLNMATATPVAPATAAGSSGGRQPVSITRGDTNVDITVQGGPATADTARAVQGATSAALGEADRRNAAHALFRGNDGGDEG